MATILVHGVPVPVSIMDGRLLQVKALDPNIVGHYNSDDGILLRNEQYHGGKVAGLFHEALHGAFPEMSESQVIELERFIPGFITSNGGSLDWLESIVADAQSEYDAESADDGDDTE